MVNNNFGAPEQGTQFPLSTSALARALEIGSYKGRTWLETELDEALTSHESGYVVIEGQAGVGKTAFLLHLSVTRGWPHHFVREHGADPALALGNLAAQLGDGGETPLPWGGGETYPSSKFYDLLATHAEQRRARGEPPLVLAIDAIDEVAYLTPGYMPLGLPSKLPSGVFIVMTRTPGIRHLPTASHRIDMLRDDVRNQQDLRNAINEFVNESQIRDLLIASSTRPENLAESLVEKVGGLWLYLKLLFDDIREGREGIGAIADLPEQLEEYYAHRLAARYFDGKKSWARLCRPLLAALGAAQEPLTLETFCAIANIKDLHRADHLLVTEWRPFLDVRIDPISGVETYRLYHPTLSRFVTHDGSISDAMPHPHAHLRRQLLLATRTAHDRIANAYLAAFGLAPRSTSGAETAPDESIDDTVWPVAYGRRHLATHLIASEREAELHQLFTSDLTATDEVSRWFALHLHLGSIRDFSNSLRLAYHQATVQTDAEVAAGEHPVSMALEIRYMLIAALLRSRSTSLPPNLVARLASVDGRREEALAMARQMRPAPQIAAILMIAMEPPGDEQLLIDTLKYLPAMNQGYYDRAKDVLFQVVRMASDTMVPHILESLPRMEQDQRAQALVELAGRLEPLGLLDTGITIADGIEYGGYRCEVFTELASSATGRELKERLQREAIQGLARTPVWLDEDRAEKLADTLAPALLIEAIDQVGAGDLPDADKTHVQAVLATRLPSESERQGLLAELTATAFSLARTKDRCSAVGSLAPFLSKAQRLSALDIVARLGGRPRAADLVCALAPYLDSAERDRAMSLVFELKQEDDLLKALRSLAPYLEDSAVRRTTQRILQLGAPLTIANRALALAGPLKEPSSAKVDALNAALRAAKRLSGYEHVAVLVSAAEATHAEFELFHYVSKKVIAKGGLDLLVRLASIESYADHRGAVLNAILDRLSAGNDEPSRDKVIAVISPLLDDQLTERALRILRRRSGLITRDQCVAATAMQLARVTANGGNTRSMAELLAIARATGGKLGQYDMMLSFLDGGIEAPYRSEFLQHVIKKDGRQETQVLLARLVPTDTVPALFDLAMANRAKEKVSPESAGRVGIAAAPRLDDHRLSQLLATIESVAHLPTRVELLTALLPFIPDAGERGRVSSDALAAIHSMPVYMRQHCLLAALVEHRPELALEALSAFEAKVDSLLPICHPQGDHFAIAKVAAALTNEEITNYWTGAYERHRVDFIFALTTAVHDRLSPHLLAKAVVDDYNDGDGTFSRHVLSVAAGDLDNSDLNDFLGNVRSLVDDDTYAEWLCVFAAQTPEFADAAAVACEGMSDPQRRTRAAARTALTVSVREVNRFLAIVTRESLAMPSRTVENAPLVPHGGVWMDAPRGDRWSWLSSMLARVPLTSWPYLRPALGDPEFEQLLPLIPLIIGLAPAQARTTIGEAVCQALFECSLSARWDEV